LSYLLDTNVVSELRKGERTDPNVASWFAGISPESIYISVLTVGEIRKGIEKIRPRDEAAAKSLDSWLKSLLEANADRILPIDQAIAERWGHDNVADPLPVLDSLLAATARVHDLTLVTRNIKDVKRSGVTLLNPFDFQPKVP